SEQEVNGEIARLTRINEASQDDVTYSIDLAGDLMVSAASGQLQLSNQDKYQLNQRFLSEMTVNEANHAFKRVIAPQSRLLLVTQPVDKRNPAMPIDDLASLWRQVMKQPQPEWMIENHHAVLPVIEPKAGTVKRE
ncbi:hypothetical protein AKJ18_35910, partial [Vibrio xuii]